MARSGAAREIRLVSLPGLLLMLAVILAVLYLLVPRRALFEDPALLENPDPLAIAYLRAVLRTDPSRRRIRLALARQMIRSGQYAEAERLLAALPATDSGRRLLETELLERRMLAATDTETRRRLARELEARLRDFRIPALSSEGLENLLERARHLPGAGGARLRLELLRTLARRQPHRAARWWQEAAREALAAGEPATAARFLERAAREVGEPGQAEVLRHRALDAMLMADRPPDALAMAARLLERNPDDIRLLRRGIAIALAAGRPQTALAWNRRLRALRPGNPAVWRQARDLALATGDSAGALEAALALRELSGSGTADERRLLARLLEWNGRPREALAVWRDLAADGGTEEDLEAVVRLSRATLDPAGEVAALERLARLRPLDARDHWRLAELYRLLGEPERAEEVLAAYLRNHPRAHRFWEARLQLAEDLGDPDLGLEILAEMERRLGRSDSLLRRRARLLWLKLDEAAAWRTLRQLESPLEAPALYDLELYGELAWRRGDTASALAFYHDLLRRAGRGALPAPHEASGPLLRTALRRLVILAEQAERPDLLAEAAEFVSAGNGDPEPLLAAADALMRLERPEEAERLLHRLLAQAPPPSPARLHLLLGELQLRRGAREEAIRSFRRALALDDSLNPARAALLWALVDGEERDLLSSLVTAWRARAEADPVLWGPFAAALELLGRPQEALAWYRRQIGRRARDPLWLLGLADLLETTGAMDSAWRIRRLALERMAPLPEGERHLPPAERQRLLRLLADVEGVPRAERRLEETAMRELLDDPLFAAAWLMNRDADEGARRWLARAHLRRLQLPGWQAVAEALRANDTERLARLLESGRLAPLDRVRAQERLGRDHLALAGALSLVDHAAGEPVRKAATQWAALLYRELPDTFTLGGAAERIGELDLNRLSAAVRLSRRNLSLRLSLDGERLEIDPAIYDLSGRDRETRFLAELEWQGAEDRFTLGLGLRKRPDRTHGHVLASWEHRLDRRHRFTLSLETNGLSNATQLVRADTLADRLRLDWTSDLTARTGLSLAFEAYRLESRHGGHLADGLLAEFGLSEKWMLGTNELAVRLQGSMLENDLARHLPPDMADRMAPGATVRDVIDDRYSVLGAGLSLARGEPMARAPLVGGLRYRIDAWAGWEWPEDGPAFSFSAAVGHRLFGSDELSLGYYYSRALNLGPGQASQGLTLQYRLFLGR